MNIAEAKELLEQNGYHVEKLSEYKKELLNEMAVDRKFIQNKAEAEFYNILTNWCLLKYISDTGEKQQLQKHWQAELSAAIRYVWKYRLTKGNDRSIVYAAIKQQYIDFAEYDQLNLADEIEMKFIEEQIEDADLAGLANAFKEQLERIMQLIAFGTSEEIKKFVLSI